MPRTIPDRSLTEELLAAVYGITGEVEPLPGEHDANFAVRGESGERFVLKLHASSSPLQVVDLQVAALAHLGHAVGRASQLVPRAVPTLDGLDSTLVEYAGEQRLVRLTTWLEGALWADLPVHREALLVDLGAAVAAVDAALADFEHPGDRRDLLWNLRAAPRHLEFAGAIQNPALRARVQQILERHRDHVEPLLAGLPEQAIHNDANDRNVLVRDTRVSGLLDLGDLCVAPRVCGLAVACAYAMLGQTRPVVGVLPLIAGYHEQAALLPEELDLLFDLICSRLAMSVCMAAKQSAEQPHNTYLLVSQEDVAHLLALLAAESRDLARLRIRNACGYEPVPTARAVRGFLQAIGASIHPVLRPELMRAEPVVLDWSTGSPTAGEVPTVPLSIGRYREDRPVYTSAAFETDDPTERRSVHVALDLFTAAGEPVLAPLDGIVRDVEYRPDPCDFGGVVLLEHRTDDGVAFWTLYGHLAEASARARRVGEAIAAGQEVGRIGAYAENGNWAPHLHLQLLTDHLGMGCGVHGVAARSELDVWESISPNPNLLVGLEVDCAAPRVRTRDELVRVRRRSLSRALSLSYREPLKIVRGEGAYLYDDGGRAWLDLVNNVCHVGHCHPRVVAAAQAQIAELNTNTRYLHDALAEYVRELAATFPDPLSVVFLTNSGSEANDLALRLARAHTGRRDVLALDHAYHGNLTSLVEISPYKFAGPGGTARPKHTWVCPLPDPYRGLHRAPQPRLGEHYADHVEAVIGEVQASTGAGPGAFIAESLPGCAGQIELPAGYLRAAYAHVRAAGGVCIADEVQVGLGRVGSHVWAFETQGVVPDIVTLGKPIGNGHPLGAVVTTPAVARSFETGMEYFNTFGGNPVSCRVGLAVLGVMRDERLQARAADVGAHLRRGLEALAERHQLIGDVRGRGLYLGVELVRDRERRDPARAEAAAVVEGVKRRGVLLSTDGPDANVLKIKPPLAVSREDCDRFRAALDSALEEVG
jgi:4-aminobutyrate aminotransferase-like enzyme/Ser/Thr protein kinase RdoA (MazF antagonist)/murein DD-endopeptidase MepM/ murein hydrolase activator NlpD